MKIGKLNKPKAKDDVIAEQGLTLEEVLTKTIQANPELVMGADSQVDPVKLQQLVESIRKDLLREATYNQVADERIYTPKGREYNPEEVAALKQFNRQRLAELKSEISALKPKLDKELENIKYYIEYDDNVTSNVVVARYLFPDHIRGKLSYSEIQGLRNLSSRFTSIQADKELNTAMKKLDKETTNLDEKYKKEIDMSVYYEVFVKGEEDPFDFSSSALRATLVNPTSRLVWEAMPEKATKLSKLGFSLLKDVAILDNEISENEKDINENNIDPNIALIPLKAEVEGIDASVSALQQTLQNLDNQNSYIDNLFNGKAPVRIKVRNKKKKYEVYELDGCWDCFKNTWSLPTDFKLGLDIEYDTDSSIKKLSETWEKIKAALDIPYLLKQNFCSLVRLGNLCPIELAFVISSLVGLIKITWTQLFSMDYKGFLVELAIEGILKPLLNALQIGLNLSFGPLENYKLCTMNSLVSIQDIDRTGAWGFKSEDLYAWLNGQTNEYISAKIDDKTSLFNGLIEPEPGKTFNSSGNPSVLGGVINRKGEVKGQAEVLKKLTEYVGNKNKFLSTVTNPLLSTGKLDVIDTVKAALDEYATKAGNDYKWLNTTIDAVNSYLDGGANSRLELVTKVAALGTILTLAYGLFSAFKDSGIDPCINMTLPDGTTVFSSPWSAQELANMIDPENIKFYEQIDNTLGLEPGTGFNAITNPTFAYNPLTDRRFNLTNCDKARSTIISKGESIEFWKRIALGANIDNV